MKTASHMVSAKIQMHSRSERQVTAFTRFELVACLCAIALFGAVILPALVRSASRSDRVVCFSNLRQIGVAYSQFGLEHDERTPWRVSSVQGGSMDHPLKRNLSLQFSATSNTLATPKVLTDPGDQRIGLRAANNWGTGNGGLLSPAIGNNAISYFLGIDGSFTLPRTVLAGDRNVRAQDGFNCSSGLVPAALVSPPIAWTNAVHGLAGNVVFFDGSAAQLDSTGLGHALSVQDDRVGGGSPGVHFLIP